MSEYSAQDLAALREQMLEKLGGRSDVYPQQIESRFPHILARLVSLWGRPDGDVYLNSLMVADRDDRKGFPDDVAREIFRLAMVHGEITASQQKKAAGGWSSEGVEAEVDEFFSRRSNRQ